MDGENVYHMAPHGLMQIHSEREAHGILDSDDNDNDDDDDDDREVRALDDFIPPLKSQI